MPTVTQAAESPSHKKVISLRRVRLASTAGHIQIVEKGVPTEIHRSLFLEAAKSGCVDYDPRMLEAFQTAMATAKEVEDKRGAEEDPVILVDRYMRNAVKHVMLAAEDEPELLKQDGAPKVPVVRAAFDNLCAADNVDLDVKVTAELVAEYFLRVQEETAAADEDATGKRYSGAMTLAEDKPPTGDLEGDDEVGGDIDAMLERVAEQEE